MGEARNLGRSTDGIKEALLRPAVLAAINESSDGGCTSIVDIGTGDASFIAEIVGSIPKIERLVLVEPDDSEFGGFLTNRDKLPTIKIESMYGIWHAAADIFYSSNSEMHDIALTQLVLHHIHTDHEAFDFGVKAFDLLRDDGTLLMVNLHPEYINFLLERYPEKLQPLNEGFLYYFGDGASSYITPRSTDRVLNMFNAIGFNNIGIVDIGVQAIQRLKPRFVEMAEANIPMFQLLRFKKERRRLIFQTSGTVVGCKFVESGFADLVTVANCRAVNVRFPLFGSRLRPKRSDIINVREVWNGAERITTWVLKGSCTDGNAVMHRFCR